jgi:hypothetical protein
MTSVEWYAERHDRDLRYGAQPLSRQRWIVLRIDPEFAECYSGQVALLTAANLLGRMTPSLALDIADIPILPFHHRSGGSLSDFILKGLYEVDPRGRYLVRRPQDGDIVLYLGQRGHPLVVHGEGWFAYEGPEPSPLPPSVDDNPIGPALAAILAITRLYVHRLCAPPSSHLINAFQWTHVLNRNGIPRLSPTPELGNIWVVGTGSVGTVILYFLSMFTSKFTARLFDMDRVERHNITRSPIFSERHIGSSKVDVSKEFLDGCGVSSVSADESALDETELWLGREPGKPDILIPTANERNVRHVIETLSPPIQIYGTTGRNWQASMLRHIPLREPCSCCLRQPEIHSNTDCAMAPSVLDRTRGPQVDAALPFLSFGAGLMAVAEILKLTLPGYPFTANRAYFYTLPEPRVMCLNSQRQDGCICTMRSSSVHRRMIAGSRFEWLSG